VNPRVAARARSVLALLRHARGQYEDAVDEYRACAKELDELGEHKALAWVHNNLAACLIAVGRLEESVELATTARSEFSGDRFAVGSALRTQVAALNRLGRTTESARIGAEAVELAKDTGEPRQLAMALHDQAWGFVLGDGDLGRAARLAEEAISLLRSVGTRSALARALRTRGAILAGLGRREDAVRAFREARDIAIELDERPRELSCTRAIAAAWVGEGRASEAIPALHECLATYREMGSASATTITLRLLAAAYDVNGDPLEAEHLRAEADQLGDPRDTNTATLSELLLTLTAPPGR
jgi:tetratricopeptide (TPR) repeat protein